MRILEYLSTADHARQMFEKTNHDESWLGADVIKLLAAIEPRLGHRGILRQKVVLDDVPLPGVSYIAKKDRHNLEIINSEQTDRVEIDWSVTKQADSWRRDEARLVVDRQRGLLDLNYQEVADFRCWPYITSCNYEASYYRWHASPENGEMQCQINTRNQSVVNSRGSLVDIDPELAYRIYEHQTRDLLAVAVKKLIKLERIVAADRLNRDLPLSDWQLSLVNGRRNGESHQLDN